MTFARVILFLFFFDVYKVLHKNDSRSGKSVFPDFQAEFLREKPAEREGGSRNNHDLSEVIFGVIVESRMLALRRCLSDKLNECRWQRCLRRLACVGHLLRMARDWPILENCPKEISPSRYLG